MNEKVSDQQQHGGHVAAGSPLSRELWTLCKVHDPVPIMIMYTLIFLSFHFFKNCFEGFFLLFSFLFFSFFLPFLSLLLFFFFFLFYLLFSFCSVFYFLSFPFFFSSLFFASFLFFFSYLIFFLFFYFTLICSILNSLFYFLKNNFSYIKESFLKKI